MADKLRHHDVVSVTLIPFHPPTPPHPPPSPTITTTYYCTTRSLYWNYVSMFLIAAYHWWVLIPWSVLTGVNVATMMVPPPSLLQFGK